MPLDQDLRVDCTALFNQSLQNYLIIMNVNFPHHIISEAGDFRNALEKTATYVSETFGNNFPIKYQVNASFYIRNQETNDLRLFTGSFFLRGNRYLSLSGPVFINFDLVSFPDSVLNVADLDRARQLLTWTDSDSVWTFHNINSIIVSFQLSREKNHPFLVQYHLHAPRHSRRRRRHVTFNI